ncbi:hypothetical protein Taro_021800 [Colocasia esculenta]|uniref:Uncharacterized protein n=1 Tax=Colocasia esculenta TaxID=4460 RepID=A0A843V625_COLES|nr:hypothetical protein [Colocasia esculenta]
MPSAYSGADGCKFVSIKQEEASVQKLGDRGRIGQPKTDPIGRSRSGPILAEPDVAGSTPYIGVK